MFWVLFAKDNVDKSQSEVHSALAAAKIEQKLNSAGLHLFHLSFFLLVLVESSAVQPKMCTHRVTTKLLSGLPIQYRLHTQIQHKQSERKY